MKFLRRLLGVLLILAALLAALVAWLNTRGEDPVDTAVPTAAADASLLERGRYLTVAGNCMGCHTARGGEAFAGGRGIETPFGIIYTSNLTPDAETGLGRWSASQFWRALHNGRAADGRLLYPAFPYTDYTEVTRDDSDAIYAYLRSLAPVQAPVPANTLRFPYDTQAALAVWRALYFSPGRFVPDPAQGEAWNRGAYLVRGLGHCAACHSPRDALGGVQDPLGLAGGLIPMQNWYAPSLTRRDEAGLSDWTEQEVVMLLRTGVAPRGQVTGPMSEVVRGSTQYLAASDLAAMATYLRALPEHASAAREAPPPAPEIVMNYGAKVYERQCAQCHGVRGEGVPGAYPPLAGNRAVLMPNAANTVQMVLYGGFGPATAGNPQPFGMPPYILVLSDEDIAAVLTYVRQSFGNQAATVTPLIVNRVRAGEGR